MNRLDAIIDRVKALPPAPRILPELLKVLRQEEADAGEVVRLIKFDPALTAQVLRRCNSVHFGFAEPAQDLGEAVVRLGMTEIYRIVASVIGERTLGAAQKGYGIEQGELWKHCAATAVVAQTMARKLGGDESVAFTAALLHDIGKLVLSTALEGAYGKVLADTENGQHSFLEAEQAILGVEHAEIGGRLLERWKFPEPLVQGVRHHHDPAQAQGWGPLAAYVHLGDVLAHLLGHGYGYQAYAVRSRPEALELLKITQSDLEQFLLETAESIEEALALRPA
jgi:putative nucleotidyltransferase with HDIG domain